MASLSYSSLLLVFLSILLSSLSFIPNVQSSPVPEPEPSILSRIGRAFNELTIEPIRQKKKNRQSKRQFAFPASYYGPGVIPIAYPHLPPPPARPVSKVPPPRIPYGPPQITSYGPPTSASPPQSPLETLKRVYEVFRDALPISDFQDATDQLNFLLISSAFSAVGELMADMHSLNQAGQTEALNIINTIMQQMLHLLGLNNLLGLSPTENSVARSQRKFNMRLVMPYKYKYRSRRIKMTREDIKH